MAHGNELWASDGTAEGTAMVSDINPGPAGSEPLHLTVVNRTLYLRADDGAHGAELWRLAITLDAGLTPQIYLPLVAR